jgi:hypothetical protein
MATTSTTRHDESRREAPSTLLLDLVIDLTATAPPPATGHRLAELVQALTGCCAEQAELAVDDPIPTGPASADDAVRAMATALVRLKARRPTLIGG